MTPEVLRPGPVLQFWAANARDLPWRRAEAGPWGVLVSEVMLQQTPVARVLPVYLEWLARWPSPADLAAASPGDAVRAWGRLGYPRRALRLHAAATAITREHGGEVPSDPQALRSLPGIGEYTASAVAAFAFGAAVPVVDVNVHRVVSRAEHGIDDRSPVTAADRRAVADLLPADPDLAPVYSAALMELGAVVCTAARPACTRCPVADRCRWRAAGYPTWAGPTRTQAWHGTDRQVRGRIMAVLREARQPVPTDELATVWSDRAQWRRCLDSLLADGLAEVVPGPAGPAGPLVALPS